MKPATVIVLSLGISLTSTAPLIAGRIWVTSVDVTGKSARRAMPGPPKLMIGDADYVICPDRAPCHIPLVTLFRIKLRQILTSMGRLTNF